MSPDLIAFLKAWHDWATSGAPVREPFYRGAGLCFNAAHYFGNAGTAYSELRALLDDLDYPFGETDYNARWRDHTQHECPKRLAWVRERLVEAGELV